MSSWISDYAIILSNLDRVHSSFPILRKQWAVIKYIIKAFLVFFMSEKKNLGLIYISRMCFENVPHTMRLTQRIPLYFRAIEVDNIVNLCITRSYCYDHYYPYYYYHDCIKYSMTSLNGCGVYFVWFYFFFAYWYRKTSSFQVKKK